MTTTFRFAILLATLASLPSFVIGAPRCVDADDATGSSMAVVVEEDAALAFTTQVFPRHHVGEPGFTNDATQQATEVLDHLDTILKSAGSELARTVKLNVY